MAVLPTIMLNASDQPGVKQNSTVGNGDQRRPMGRKARKSLYVITFLILIIFPVILHTVINVIMLSIGGHGAMHSEQTLSAR